MQPSPLPTNFLNNLSFADLVTDFERQSGIGYHFGGDRPGPNALFASWSPTIAAISERLVNLPTLPWMWGHLFLVALDQVPEQRRSSVAKCLPMITFDEVTIVERPARDMLQKDDIEQAYWNVLRMCARLGMIQGRGISDQKN